MVLNDRSVKALKPGATRKAYFDDLVGGLALRVNAGGSKVWQLCYHFPPGRHGRLRRLKLGEYPTLSLAGARKLARRIVNRMAETGKDPAAEKQAHQAPGDTFKDLAAVYMKVAEATKRSWREDKRILDSELLPAWKTIKVRDIKRRDVRTLIDAIAERPAPISANRTWALASRIFNFAIEKDWTEANPAARIGRRPEVTRDRVLTDEELRELWKTLDAVTHPPRVEDPEGKPPAISAMIARGLQTLAVTAQRPGEVFKMRREDLDLTKGAAWWTVPAQDSKNGEPHRVPLTETAVQLVKDAIAAGKKDHRYVFAGIAGGSVAARAKRASAMLRAAGAVSFDFHRHDLRRTAATNLGKLGFPTMTIAYVLNHVDRSPRATLVYQRYEHDAEKRTALEAWERRLTAILTATDQADNLVPFARA